MVPTCNSTELVLAFPLGDNHGREDCKVFAFLPVYSAGLRFVVHADFELVASRQQLRHDSAWNQMLRTKVAQAFVAAMTSSFTTPHPRPAPGQQPDSQAPPSGGEGVARARGLEGGGWQGALYKYLPVGREITCEFWKPLVTEIRDLLKVCVCVCVCVCVPLCMWCCQFVCLSVPCVCVCLCAI